MNARRFSITDGLPTEALLIQASAGTGKTHTLSSLTTRFIAERDVRASELLVVTFTKAATAELRDRIRGRLVQQLALLDEAADGDDEITDHLRTLSPNDLDRAVANLQRAVEEFDTATISTIHGFAGQALALLGHGDEADGGYVDDSRRITEAVAADVLTAASIEVDDIDILPSLGELTDWSETFLERPGLRLRPEPEEAGAAGHRAEICRNLVERVIETVIDQRRALGQRSYGDVLTRLRSELEGEGGAAAAELIRQRYRVALVDEFQDTDPDQWAIFDALFGSGNDVGARSNLVLVGDPKQAIYAFRGADITTYVAAAGRVGDVRSLRTNWRSDGAMLSAVEALFDGVVFGQDTIPFEPVSPTPANSERRLLDASGRPLPALDLRVRLNEDIETTSKKVSGDVGIKSEAGRREILIDLAERVRELLEGGRIPDGSGYGTADGGPEGVPADALAGTRPVRPGDVAVLVRTAVEAEKVRDLLLSAGIPAVLARGTSVLKTPAAEQWRWLLEALGEPTSLRRARAFALSWFGGRTATWLDDASDDDLAPLQEQLWTWSRTLATEGLEALLREVFLTSGVVERLIGTSDGDRSITDLEHVAELLRSRGRGTVGIAGLLAAIAPTEGGAAADPDGARDEDAESRRVESEAEAVQVMTVWVAKGLEFPIVCCPTMWSAGPKSNPCIYLDEDEKRSYDILDKEKWPDRATAAARADVARAERDGEALRLLYVALTRARHQTILWWARIEGANSSPLGRVLFARDESGAIDSEALSVKSVDLPPEDEVIGRLEVIAEKAGDGGSPTMTVSSFVAPPVPGRWKDDVDRTESVVLDTAVLDRVPDRRRNRWSFSSISERAGDTHEEAIADEPHSDTETAPQIRWAEQEPETTEASPLAPLPASAAFGLLIHSIYEHIDFTDPNLPTAVDDRLGRELEWRGIDLSPPALPDESSADGRRRVVDGVIASLRTPLGSDVADRSLSTFGRRDRLDELDFEIHLDGPGGSISDAAIGRTLLEHLGPNDPQLRWAESVAEGAFDVDLAGHLTGSVDLILRVAEAGGADRFLVIDYKTNRLHDPAGMPGPDDYGQPRLHQEMSRHHYSLQALLYSVALHRYLRWRVPGYDPEANLGGVRYLFVRGMAGLDARRADGSVQGVCRWDLPPAAVVAVSDLLAGKSE